jgi:hypothetical protein
MMTAGAGPGRGTGSRQGAGSRSGSPAPRTGAVAGDAATRRVIWDRAGHQAEPATAKRVTAALAAMSTAADGNDLKATGAAVPSLRTELAQLAP